MTGLPPKETLTVEFKSDAKRLPDRDLVEAIVCMANGEGGTIFLGVEKDGTPTGLHAAHTNLAGLPALVANLTVPAVVVEVATVEDRGKTVAAITVPKATKGVVSTTTGTTVRRRLKADGVSIGTQP